MNIDIFVIQQIYFELLVSHEYVTANKDIKLKLYVANMIKGNVDLYRTDFLLLLPSQGLGQVT